MIGVSYCLKNLLKKLKKTLLTSEFIDEYGNVWDYDTGLLLDFWVEEKIYSPPPPSPEYTGKHWPILEPTYKKAKTLKPSKSKDGLVNYDYIIKERIENLERERKKRMEAKGRDRAPDAKMWTFDGEKYVIK